MNMKKKKILMIHHSGLIGGAGVSFYNLWAELKNEYIVTAYIANKPFDYISFLKEKGLEPKEVPFRMGKLTYYSGGNKLTNPKFWYHALNSVFQIKYWRRIISAEKPDLIIVNSKVLCWMGLIFKSLNIKSICFVRETIPGDTNSIMNKLMKKMLERFDLVAFISRFDLKQTNLIGSKTIVFKNSLDINEYKGAIEKREACSILNISSKKFNVLFVGGIDMLKGIDVAVEAMRILDDKDINLLVAGKDFGYVDKKNSMSKITALKKRKAIRFSKNMKNIIKNENLEGNIKFLGVQKDMSLLYSACDILIFPMKKPHQARPVFEIGVQSKPVIISDFPHIEEFVEHGVNGLKFRPNDATELAKSIIQLKEDQDLLRELGCNNYQLTIKNHIKEVNIRKFTNAINELLNQ